MAIAKGLIVPIRRAQRAARTMVGSPMLLGRKYHRMFGSQRANAICRFGRRMFPPEIAAGQAGQNHVVINVKQPFIREKPQVVWSRRTFPDGERSFVCSRCPGFEAAAGHAVGNEGYCLIAAHDVKRPNRVVPSGLVGAGEDAPVIVRIHYERCRLTLDIGQTRNSDRLSLGFAQSRQEQRGEDRDDGNDHEQFNERERLNVSMFCSHRSCDRPI